MRPFHLRYFQTCAQVTARTPAHLWLHEGVASHPEHSSAHSVLPRLGLDTVNQEVDVGAAFRADDDVGGGSRPVVTEADTREEVRKNTGNKTDGKDITIGPVLL